MYTHSATRSIRYRNMVTGEKIDVMLPEGKVGHDLHSLTEFKVKYIDVP